jgi:hypothetical protein
MRNRAIANQGDLLMSKRPLAAKLLGGHAQLAATIEFNQI